MKILIREDMDLEKAHEEYSRFTEDEELREVYEARMKWRKDYISGFC